MLNSSLSGSWPTITSVTRGPAFGIDASPAMIEVARSEHPGLRFEVGSMDALELADGELAGIVSW